MLAVFDLLRDAFIKSVISSFNDELCNLLSFGSFVFISFKTLPNLILLSTTSFRFSNALFNSF